MAFWWEILIEFLIGTLVQMGYILGVQFLNISILWQLLPIYTSWFAIQFITRNREEEDMANRFMNGFALLWVGFQLGEYIIQNFFTDPYIILKALIVVGLFAYAIFIMRLTLMNKDITRYIARIGEISAINIAAMLFIQDLLVITDGIQLIQMTIGFVIIYATLDLGFQKLVDYIYGKVKLPITEEEKKPVEAPEPAPRYERITKPTVAKPVKPIARPAPPVKPRITPPPARPTVTPPARPAITPPPRPPAALAKPPVKKVKPSE